MFESITDPKVLLGYARSTLLSDKYRKEARELYYKYKPKPIKVFKPEIEDDRGTTYNIPDSAFEHKEYPTCKCGRKFVPIEKGDKICFYCKLA